MVIANTQTKLKRPEPQQQSLSKVVNTLQTKLGTHLTMIQSALTATEFRLNQTMIENINKYEMLTKAIESRLNQTMIEIENRLISKIEEIIPEIPAKAEWAQYGVTVAGGTERGNATNQLGTPRGLFVDDDQTIVIADSSNNRIVQWKVDDTNGQIVAGGNGHGTRLDQMKYPVDVLIDKETDSLIICDQDNRRVVRWSRRNDTKQGEILIGNIDCYGLAIDDQKHLFVSDYDKDEVKRYQIGDKNGTLVAGGNGEGNGLNQLKEPTYIFVDQQQTLYVSDRGNHRVMKWNKGATEGIVIAGGQGSGSALTQLNWPQGLFVDTLGTVYVTNYMNDRVVRWPKGAEQGTVILGGNGNGKRANQFDGPIGLAFDRHGNLYISDSSNNRVQRFSIQ
ncbi:unnamed protein product [Rotaria sp. Silwood2]|nr:unnamed protein product [Rotaria sp. Silwood2]CAF4506847.1 unnamed protein product [Rotaria sp. Silwood2]